MNNAIPMTAVLCQVRDVVETYLRFDIVEPGWSAVIMSAADRLESDPDAHELAQRLRKMAAGDIRGDRALVDRVAEDTLELIKLTWPKGLPRPQDDDRSFLRVSGA